jgi:predicted DNA-binding protein (MmcQ/YjbR family)
MDADALRSLCLGFEGAVETFPFGPETHVFKVEGKIFALTRLDDPLKVSLKCEPELAVQLRRDHEAIVGGYHLNKRHWNTVSVNGVPAQLVRDMIEDSYDLIVSRLPRGTQIRLGWSTLER